MRIFNHIFYLSLRFFLRNNIDPDLCSSDKLGFSVNLSQAFINFFLSVGQKVAESSILNELAERALVKRISSDIFDYLILEQILRKIVFCDYHRLN